MTELVKFGTQPLVKKFEHWTGTSMSFTPLLSICRFQVYLFSVQSTFVPNCTECQLSSSLLPDCLNTKPTPTRSNVYYYFLNITSRDSFTQTFCFRSNSHGIFWQNREIVELRIGGMLAYSSRPFSWSCMPPLLLWQQASSYRYVFLDGRFVISELFYLAITYSYLLVLLSSASILQAVWTPRPRCGTSRQASRRSAYMGTWQKWSHCTLSVKMTASSWPAVLIIPQLCGITASAVASVISQDIRQKWPQLPALSMDAMSRPRQWTKLSEWVICEHGGYIFKGNRKGDGDKPTYRAYFKPAIIN